MTGPLLTREVHEALHGAMRAGRDALDASLDLGRSTTAVALDAAGWSWQGAHYPWMARCRDRTIYHWTGEAFEPVARFSGSHLKLVPTPWGTPTFEIDGIKMLVSSKVSPWEDARRKVELVQPRGKIILDTCGGLGYYAAWCLASGAAQVLSFEKNPDVLWLRSLNPWSPQPGGALSLELGDISTEILALPDASVDAVLHDPPRFGIAGELYSLVFYRQLARVLRRKGRLFHYVGTPNALTSGRHVPREVAKRLGEAGFSVQPSGDGLLATRR
jgi:predicted methyltransferase